MHQLAPWMIKHKPTTLLALHATHFPHDRAAQKVIKDMMLTYKTVRRTFGGPEQRGARVGCAPLAPASPRPPSPSPVGRLLPAQERDRHEGV